MVGGEGVEMEHNKGLGKNNLHIQLFPARIDQFMIDVGGLFEFTIKFFKNLFTTKPEFQEYLNQSYQLGYKSLSLVGITAFIMGLVLTIQSRPTMQEFGAESFIPAMVTISILREIGPVITALICAGKIGSGIGAELGSMRVTEQIDAMEVSGINPFSYLASTRILATVTMIPVLVFWADAIAFYGSYIGVNINGKVSLTLFYNLSFDSIVFSDIFPSTIKTIFFGLAIGLVGCYKGYYASSGTEGVGKASNSAVVMASLLIFILDMIAAQITDFFYY